MIIRGTTKLAVLEKRIRAIDNAAQDVTRSAFTNRAITMAIAENVDWVAVSEELLNLILPANLIVPSTIMVDIEDQKAFDQITLEIGKQLHLIRLRKTYVLTLLWAYYFKWLKAKKSDLQEADNKPPEELSPPAIMAKLTEIILANDQEKLDEIREVLRRKD